jgi:hypothetical protein
MNYFRNRTVGLLIGSMGKVANLVWRRLLAMTLRNWDDVVYSLKH